MVVVFTDRAAGTRSRWRRLGGREEGGLLIGCGQLLSLAQVNGSLDVLAAEDAFRGVLVMGSAEESQVGGLVAAAECARMDMIELEEIARGATFAFFADERALVGVARDDLAASGGGNRGGWLCFRGFVRRLIDNDRRG